MQPALESLESLKFETELNERRSGADWRGAGSRHAFNAVFFSTMAWCLTKHVSVVRRRTLPEDVERHLIAPGHLGAEWRDRIAELSGAHEDEHGPPDPERRKTNLEDVTRWAVWAREFNALGRGAVETSGVDITTTGGPN